MDLQFLGDAAMQSFGATLGSIIGGGLCGLGPLVVAFNRRRQILGVIAFLVCLGCGFAMGILLAFPIALIAAVGFSNLERRRRRHR